MSLPSQHLRMGGRVVTTRRRRRSPRQVRQRVVVGGIVGLLVLVTWWMWPGGGKPGTDAEGAPIASADGTGEPLNFLAENGLSETGDGSGASRSSSVPASMRSDRGPDRAADRGEDQPTTRSGDRGEAERRSSMPPLVISQSGNTPGVLGADRASGEGSAGDPPRNLATPERRPETVPVRPGGSTSANLEQVLAEASRLESEGKLVAARDALNGAMFSGWASEDDRAELRVRMSRLSEKILFSTDLYTGDPMTRSYQVRGGDALSKIATREKLAVDWRLLQRVNGLARPESIRVGQTLKVVQGPFHAVVDKSDYRLDLYWGDPERPAGWIFVRSYRVGLGEEDSTPIGRFFVKRNSRLEKPAWTNPRTGERHAPGEGNPIGLYWIGIEGEGESAQLSGYGLHGTNEPGSIGQQMSMGCVRLGDADIAEVFSLLVEQESRVRIVP